MHARTRAGRTFRTERNRVGVSKRFLLKPPVRCTWITQTTSETNRLTPTHAHVDQAEHHTGHGGRLKNKSKQASNRDRSPSRRLATHFTFALPAAVQYEDM